MCDNESSGLPTVYDEKHTPTDEEKKTWDFIRKIADKVKPMSDADLEYKFAALQCGNYDDWVIKLDQRIVDTFGTVRTMANKYYQEPYDGVLLFREPTGRCGLSLRLAMQLPHPNPNI